MTFADAADIAKADGCKVETYADRIVVSRGGRMFWLRAEALVMGADGVREAIATHLPKPA